MKISRTMLRQLCIENKWFTRGDNEQYSRLFQANEQGASPETLATIIWECSDAEYSDILEKIAEKNPHTRAGAPQGVSGILERF